MASLIRDSIKTMGDPNGPVNGGVDSNDSKVSCAPTISSIPVLESVKDWWSSSSQLMDATSEVETEVMRKAKLRNREIEYQLYRAVLSDDIYLYEVKDNEDIENIENTENTEDIENNEDTGDNETPMEGITPTTPSPLKNHKLTGQLLDIPIEDGFIHEFYLENNELNTASLPELHLVIIHGYMAALGYFLKNIEPLLRSRPGIRLHILDMPGFGNSSRPQFPRELLTEPQQIPDKIKQILAIENWFIDRLETWRKARHLRNFKIIAHSMGGYLSSCYIMKYNNQYAPGPNIVDQIMLVSPMGTESSTTSLINDKKFQFNHHQAGGDPFEELHFYNDNNVPFLSDELTKLWQKLGQPRFPKNFILENLWKYNKSPFQILQKFGPFYSKILSYWSFQRFRNLKSNESEEKIGESIEITPGKTESNIDLIRKLHNYSYSIFNQFQGSGELAITKLITHEILARLPLCDRGLVEYLYESNVESCWVYGDKDWMNSKGGEYICEKLHKLDANSAHFKIIEDAGHHIYLDNPPVFNKCCIDFFKLQ